jgi:hypothetical protein
MSAQVRLHSVVRERRQAQRSESVVTTMTARMQNAMASETSPEIDHLLMSYSGPDAERVRRAIATLARDDLQKTAHYVARARDDYRDVLWWADIQEEDDRKKQQLSGMDVNERLSHLKLSSAWSAAVARGDQKTALTILQKCALPDEEIQKVVGAHFKTVMPWGEQAQG